MNIMSSADLPFIYHHQSLRYAEPHSQHSESADSLSGPAPVTSTALSRPQLFPFLTTLGQYDDYRGGDSSHMLTGNSVETNVLQYDSVTTNAMTSHSAYVGPHETNSKTNTLTNNTVEEANAGICSTDDSADSGNDEIDLQGRNKNDGPMVSPPNLSKLKTKAGEPRKRLPLACLSCRRMKIRCSGEKPTCERCLRFRIPCAYRTTQSRSKPRSTYATMLEKRLRQMEDRINELLPLDERGDASAFHAGVANPGTPSISLLNTSLAAQHGGKARDAVCEPLAKYSQERGVGTSHGDDKVQIAVTCQKDEEQRLVQEGIESLPSSDIQEHLAEVFFDNINNQTYYLLHKPSYMRDLRCNALPPVLVLSVCAVAARFSTNPKICPAVPHFLRGGEWASRARDICNGRCDCPSLAILTCLLILGLHEFGTCHGSLSWALLAQAIQMAFALRLHEDSEHRDLYDGPQRSLTFVDRETRHRIMWTCFLMDRLHTSGRDRPLLIKDTSVEIRLPAGEKCYELGLPLSTGSLDGNLAQDGSSDVDVSPEAECGSDVAAYIIKSIAIWGRIIAYIDLEERKAERHPVWSPESSYTRLTEDIADFVKNLPRRILYSPENLRFQKSNGTASQYFILHLSIEQNLLFLHQAAAADTNEAITETPRDFFRQTRTSIDAAANGISNILTDAERSRCCVSAPFAAYCAFFSAQVHVVNISASPSVATAAEANWRVNLSFLRKMARLWGPVHRILAKIQAQYTDAPSASRYGVKGANIRTPNAEAGIDRAENTLSKQDLTPAFTATDGIRDQKIAMDSKSEPEPWQVKSVASLSTALAPSQNAKKRRSWQHDSMTQKQPRRALYHVAATNKGALEHDSAHIYNDLPTLGQESTQPLVSAQSASWLTEHNEHCDGRRRPSDSAVPPPSDRHCTATAPEGSAHVEELLEQPQSPSLPANPLAMNTAPQPQSLGLSPSCNFGLDDLLTESIYGTSTIGSEAVDNNFHCGWTGISTDTGTSLTDEWHLPVPGQPTLNKMDDTMPLNIEDQAATQFTGSMVNNFDVLGWVG